MDWMGKDFTSAIRMLRVRVRVGRVLQYNFLVIIITSHVVAQRKSGGTEREVTENTE